MIEYSDDIKEDVIYDVAKKMVAAAVTAPKASGKDKVVAAIVCGKEKDNIVKKMKSLCKEYDEPFIGRDAICLETHEYAVLIGIRSTPFGLNNCSMCGFKSCAEMTKADGNCALNITDLGIAIGSAVSIAADNRIDNRVMYSIGKAVSQMEVFPSDVRVCYGIPLSVSSKSPFFDRGYGAVLI